MKKHGLLLALCIAGVMIFTGCGIAQETYDGILSEADTIEQQTGTVHTDIEGLQADITGLKQQITETEADATAVSDNITLLEEEGTGLTDELAEKQETLAGLLEEIAGKEAENAIQEGEFFVLDFNNYYAVQEGVSVDFPEGWTFSDETAGDTTTYSYSDPGSTAACTLVVQSGVTGTTQQYVTSYINALSLQYNRNFLLLQSTDDWMFANGRYLVFYTLMDHGVYEKAYVSSIVVDNGKAYVYTCQCGWDDYPRMAYAFHEMQMHLDIAGVGFTG